MTVILQFLIYIGAAGFVDPLQSMFTAACFQNNNCHKFVYRHYADIL